MKRVHSWALLAIAGTVSLCTSCTATNTCSQCLISAFQGFNRVGEYPDSTKEQAFGWEPYVRSRKRSGAVRCRCFGRLAGQIRLRWQSTRCRIDYENVLRLFCRAPAVRTILPWPAEGGPFWSIRFRVRNCFGEITNKFDRNLDAARIGWPSGSRDDYIVRLKPAKRPKWLIADGEHLQ